MSADSDRSQFKEVLLGSFGSGRDVVNAVKVIAQDAQRFQETCLVSGQANNVNVNYSVARVERAVKVVEARILPSAALTQDTGNLVISYGYTNDNGGSFVTLGQINTNTTANGGTGNWTAYQSIVVTANAAQTQPPANSFLGWKTVNSGAGLAIPSGTTLQILWEEV